MRTIIAGSRDITAESIVHQAILDAPWEPTVVLSGDCRGVDRLGAAWARSRGIPVECYEAEWAIYGNVAGPIRNRLMVSKADALIVVRYPDSRGSLHVLTTAQVTGRRIHDVVIPRP